MGMNPLYFLQYRFLHDKEKIMKIISKSTFRNTTRFKNSSQFECTKKKIEFESPI